MNFLRRLAEQGLAGLFCGMVRLGPMWKAHTGSVNKLSRTPPPRTPWAAPRRGPSVRFTHRAGRRTRLPAPAAAAAVAVPARTIGIAPCAMSPVAAVIAHGLAVGVIAVDARAVAVDVVGRRHEPEADAGDVAGAGGARRVGLLAAGGRGVARLRRRPGCRGQ